MILVMKPGGINMNLRMSGTCGVALLMLVASASGQWNERYWHRMNKRDVERVIRNVELGANDFRKDFDRWLDHSRLEGSEKEDRYNSKVKAFERATDKLRSEFDRSDKWWETRANVQETLTQARPVAEMMRRNRFGRDLEFQWNKLRKALNKLASTYQLRGIA
jgi:hypothetical protein